ncbi:dynein heavy chain domain-containing protein 1-like [Bolinopsis microptera]|uniref:dynein heavy chain domain-containing protein 1-like n=1 Tax=Bolinopsis microptera TaxID=2820187 RepID=UPI0030798D96
MTESQSLVAPYNIGLNERNELGVVSEAARRIAAASVPVLCGTTSSDHLITLLDSISLLSSDLQDHSQVKHYVERICFYLERNPNTKLQSKIKQIFPKLAAAYKRQVWQTGTPRATPAQQRTQHAEKRSRAHHVPGPEVFLLRDAEVEKVALLTMADLRDSLPNVACEMASYEAAWRGALGSTAAALKLRLADNISSDTVHLRAEEVVEPQTVVEATRKSFVFPKSKPPRTGREVVDHILSGMLTTQTYIAYLNKPNPTRPYHLIVVPKSKLQPEHFIMSSFGVMHVLPNGDNEVYSLSKWLRNAQIYDHIIDIRFFKHFNLLRHFLRWRINAVLERFERHRNIIQNDLLITVPTFGKNLLQIHALIFELMTVPKTSIEHIIPGTLKNFSDTAKKQLQFLIKYITRFLHYTKQLDATADQYLTSRLQDATVNNRPSPDYLTNPISVQKEKKHMRLQYLQLCRSQHSCLPNYRRSVQFMVQNLVVNFVADSTIHLIGKIENFIGEGSGSLVTINLVYGLSSESEDVIISYPPIDNIESTLFSLLPNIASAVLSCAREWLPDNALLKPDKVNQILSYNKEYSESLSRYQEVLETALNEVQEYCREKEWLCEIRAFVRTWKSVDRYKGSQATYIQEVLEKLKFWSQHVESLTTEFDTTNNLFHISCSALYSALQPALGEIYESLITMVQSEFDERGARLIEETQNKHQMLKAQKAEVSSFAEYAKTLSNVKLNTEELLAEKEYIKSLYGILQKLKIDNPLMAEIDKRLQLQWELYLMVLHDGETFITKEAPAMLQGLDEQIKTLEIEAEMILRKISQVDSPYCNPNTDHAVIMPLVEDAKKKILELKETMTMYSDWKFSISNNYHNLQKIQVVQTKVDARHDVWATLQTVCQTVQTWQETKFSEFDTISASAQIQTWLQTADYLRSVLPERDRILTNLDIKIDNVSKFVPLLVQLSSESVKTHHWQEIHICMSEMYDSKQELYVSHLMTSKLLQNKDVISRICGQALTEHTLEQSMVELEQYWECREFTLRKISIPKQNPNKNRKPASESVFILDSEDNIIGQIDDHQVLLQSMLASPYIQELHVRAETWLVLLQQLHVIMHLWPVCHTNWLYLTDAHVEGKTEALDEEDIHVLLEADRDFRQLLIVTWEDPLVMSLFGKKSLSNVRELQGDKLILRLETLQRHQEGLMKQLGLVVLSARG